MSIPSKKSHEANFDYILKQNLDLIIEKSPNLNGLTVELQPVADQVGRADLIIRDGIKPLIVFETKKSQQDVDSISVHRKAREYAMTLKSEYFVVSNLSRTYLFKNDMGPLRELQIKLWDSSSNINVKLMLEDILHYTLNKAEKQSRKEIFLEQYERLFSLVVEEYIKILHSSERIGKLKNQVSGINSILSRAEKQILNYMGVELNNKDLTKREETIDNLSSQAGYLLLNKIFCYEVIRIQFYKQFSKKLPKIFRKGNILPLQNQLNNTFKNLITTFDFAPIFQPDGFFSEINFSKRLEELIKEFIDELSEFDLENLEEDFIGEMYQKLIPLEKKKELGQIYTPVDIANLMVDLAIKNPKAIILDPACGCGTFLKQIYHKLVNLNSNRGLISESSLHSQLLSQIWGIEINSFPAHLSMMNLTFMNLSSFSDLVGILIHDFLELGPIEKYNVSTRNLRTGERISREMPRKFDVIIANPPYVKQEKIPKKKKIQKNLPIFASYRSLSYSEFQKLSLNEPAESENQYLIKKLKVPNVKLELKGQTDYYGYFLWYSTFFLKNSGILCFIVPNKWLDVKYGLELKNFLLDYYKIQAIIAYEHNVFPDAQVSTVIILLKRTKEKSKRDNHVVRFITLKSQQNSIWLKEFLNTKINQSLYREIVFQNYLFSNPSSEIRVTLALQSSLNSEEKWSIKYLYQSEFIRLLSSKSIIKLKNSVITEVVPGMKTSANSFFFPSEQDRIKYQFESIFLKPGIKSGRDIPKKIVIEKAPMYFLSIPSETKINQYKNLYKFINDGVKILKYPDRPSLKWKPWYSIPEKNQDIPDILFLRHIDSEFTAHLNQIGCIVSDGVRGVKIYDSKHILFYLGVFNSTYFYWQAHIHGRWEAQGDLQLLVYELENIEVPDIRKLEESVIQEVEKSIEDIIDKQKSIINEYSNISDHLVKDKLKISQDQRKRLDKAVLKALNLSNSYDILIYETTLLETIRLNRFYSK